MKTKILFSLGLVVCFVWLAMAATIEDKSGTTIRYRNGSYLSFDKQSGLKDEDSGWTINPAQLLRLSAFNSANFLGSTNPTIASGSLVGTVGASNIVGAVAQATNAINATNFWGLLSPTNLPAGLSSSNYVGTFIGNGASLTGIVATASTNVDSATYASAADWSTNWAQAAYKADSTNAAVVNSLLVNSVSTSWGVQLAVRGQAAQTNDIFQVQNLTADPIFGIGPSGHFTWANAPTNATGSTAAVLWLKVTNNGTAYTIPLHALSD